MTITEKTEGDVSVFLIAGKLDTITSPEVQAKLIPAFEEHLNVVLDMGELVYVSSAGLRVLLLAQKTAAAKKGSFAIRSVPSDVMGILSMTGLDKVLTIA